jgi:uncharacterized protein
MSKSPKGCGLGLRSEFIHQVYEKGLKPSWFEITPENWIHMHAGNRKAFERIVSDFPIGAHGLSLSIGSNTLLDQQYLKTLRTFLDRYDIQHYSEHLSFCSIDNKQLYELLPLPMTMKMVDYISDRISQAQDALGRTIVLENASYYYVPYAEMEETDFINAIMEKSGAKMLLDINNVFVNSHNHHFDAKAWLDKINNKHVAYMHIAGHMEMTPELYIDTHGAPVKDEVWELLSHVRRSGITAPALLERDNDVPDYDILLDEYAYMKKVYDEA